MIRLDRYVSPRAERIAFVVMLRADGQMLYLT